MAQGTRVPTAKTGSAIQVAIEQTHDEGGGVVYLSAGVYLLSGPIQLRSNVRLVGVGEATVLEMDDSVDQAHNVNFIELEGGNTTAAHDIEISNLTIRGPGSAADPEQDVSETPEQGCGIIALEREVRNVVIRACRIEHVSGCGIYFRTPEAHLMKDIIVQDCGLFNNKRPAERTRTEDGPNAYKDICFSGMAFENIRIEGNVCSFEPSPSNPYGNDSGIAFVNNSDQRTGSVRNVRLVGNVCSGHRRHGLVTNYDTLDLDGAFVSDNRCQNNGWAGIYVNTNADRAANARLVVSGNYCGNNGFIGPDGPDDATIRGGIVVNDADNLVISNNICLDNGRPGPTFKAHGVVAETSAVHASGIRIRGQEMIVEGNLVQGNEGSGVMIWPTRAGHVSITNNRAVENGNRGIEVAGESVDNRDVWAKQVVVTDNLCAGNKKIGILVSATDGALVAANYVFHNGKAGISLDRRTQNVSVQGNYIVATSAQQPTIDDFADNFIGDNEERVQPA